MEIIIQARHLNTTDAIKNYVIKKTSKLTKYANKITKIQFTLKIEGQNNIVEAVCSAARATPVAEVAHPDMYAAIDLVMPKLERQIGRARGKAKAMSRRPRR